MRIWLLCFVACHAPPNTMHPPPSPDLVLTTTDMLAGQPATWTVTGANPNERVYIGRARSSSPEGGPCIAAVGGMCLDLENPVTLIGTATADASGTASITVTLPSWLPSGLSVASQAVVIRGPQGADSLRSAPVDDITGLDRCLDVVCDSPPPEHCVGEGLLQTYAPAGACTGGTCSYISATETCTDCCQGTVTRPLDEPLGGGEGYSQWFDPAQATAVVLDATGFLAAVATARSGDVIYVADSAEIDLTGHAPVDIPDGVIVASGRGHEGSLGGVIRTSDFTANPLLRAGEGARLTGVRLLGPDGELGDHDYSQHPLSSGIGAYDTRMEVDNCEVAYFGYAGIVLAGTAAHVDPSWIHHNHIHHNRRHGLGYGVVLGAADGLIEHNIMESARHHIAGSGVPGCGYEARYNLVFGTAQSHLFDMHGAVDFEKYKMKGLLRLDEDSGDTHADTSVFGRLDGTSIGAPMRVPGRFRGALELAEDDGVSLGLDDALSSPRGAISLWIRPTVDAIGDLVYMSESSFTDFLLLRRQADGSMRLIIEDDNAAIVDVWTDQSVPDDGEWHHVAVSQDTTGISIAIDGELATLAGTNGGAWTDHLTIDSVQLGVASWTGFVGGVDELYLYDLAMTLGDMERHAEGLADLAGERIIVHHNTFAVPEVSSMVMRGIPRQSLELRDNWFWQSDPAWAVRQINQVGGVTVGDNHYGPRPPVGVVLPEVIASVTPESAPAPVDVAIEATDSVSPIGRPLRWRFGDSAFGSSTTALRSEATPGSRPQDVFVLDDLGGLTRQTLSTVQEAEGLTLMFTYKDGYRGPLTHKLRAEALVDGVVVWSRDLAGAADWEHVAVDVSTLVAADAEEARVTFRLYAESDVDPSEIIEADVFIDDVHLGPNVVNPGFEAASGWTLWESHPSWGGGMDAWDFSTGRRGAHLTMPYNRGAVADTWVEYSQLVRLVGGPMVAELWMDDGLEDRGHDQLPCTLVGQDPSWVQGIRQGALLLDGVGRVACGGPQGSPEGSLSMWFRADTDGVNRDLLEISETGYTDYLLVRVNSADRLYLRIEDGDAALVNLTSTETVDTGVWHHLVLTQDGTGITAWLDGTPLTLIGTDTGAWTAHLDATEMFIGNTRWASLVGAVDELVLDDEAWDAERVAVDGRLGLVSRWPMDEGTGPVVDDYTGASCILGVDTAHTVVDGVAGVDFDGGRLTCDVATLGGLVGDRGSISLWARIDDLSRDHDLLNLFQDGYQNYMLLRRTAAGRVLLSIEEADAEVLGARTASGAMNDTDWHHIAITHDGLQPRIYVDGMLSTQLASGVGWTRHLSLTGLWVGGGHWSSMEGTLSDLRVYDRALRPAEVAALAH